MKTITVIAATPGWAAASALENDDAPGSFVVVYDPIIAWVVEVTPGDQFDSPRVVVWPVTPIDGRHDGAVRRPDGQLEDGCGITTEAELIKQARAAKRQHATERPQP